MVSRRPRTADHQRSGRRAVVQLRARTVRGWTATGGARLRTRRTAGPRPVAEHHDGDVEARVIGASPHPFTAVSRSTPQSLRSLAPATPEAVPLHTPSNHSR
jgi:hypothetical protein